MNIVIAGNGKMGSALVQQLSAEGHDIILIDLNTKVLANAMNRYDIFTVQGNCASVKTLEQANIRTANLLLAVTGTDELNLLCCATAHKLNPNLHTIARIRNPEYSDQIYKMRDIFGLSLTVNPDRQAAVEIERLLRYPGFLKRDAFARNRVEIVELRVDEKSPLKDKELFNLSKVVGCKVLVCAVLRNGMAVMPDGSFVIRQNDRVFVTAPTESMEILLKNLGIITHKVKNVMICGGGRISYYLAQKLQKSGMTITIVDKDHDRCVYLAEQLPKARIIHGDATNQLMMESEGMAECNAVISMTGIDEMNMIISLFAEHSGVQQIITKLNHIESSNILDKLPLGSIINPKELCCNIIVRYVRAMNNQIGSAITVHTIADGQVEATEFRIDANIKHCSVPLKNMHLKKNVVIACINRNGTQIIPDGESYYVQGDTVVVVADRQNIVKNFNDIFAD